jgi:two-component system, sensor histidine kinase and response regulator
MTNSSAKSIWSNGYYIFYRQVAIICILAIVLDATYENRIEEFSLLVIKDVINIGFILIAWILVYFKLLNPKQFLVITLYSILFSIFLAPPIRLSAGSLNFNEYFVKIEFIVLLLTLTSGILINPVHNIVMASANTIFIACCILFIPIPYPILKYLFYALVIMGAGYLTAKLKQDLLKRTKEVDEAHVLITLQNGELVKLNASKDELIRIIGHDLRTPFNQLHSLSQLLEGTDNKEEVKEITQLIKEAIQQGDELLYNLLQWINPVNSTSEKIKEVNLHVLVKKVFNFMLASSSAKEIQLVNLVAPEPVIKTDLVALETVLRNFISNAIKFSKRGSQVEVSAYFTFNEVKISITDFGIGMSRETLNSIRKYESIHSEPGTENEKGTGHGWEICRNLINAQRGRLEVESESNVGTTIHIYLPMQNSQFKIQENAS